jgi:hypothetical protein
MRVRGERKREEGRDMVRGHVKIVAKERKWEEDVLSG